MAMKTQGLWWTGTDIGGGFANVATLTDGESPQLLESNILKRNGCSIRYVKDDSTNTGIMVGNDGTIYPTVKIGTKVWTARDSIETKYRSLDPIPERTDAGEWAIDLQGSRCSQDNDEDNAFVMEPTEYGWHVPTVDDFLELFAYLGGTPVSGGKLKETGFNHWNYPNTGATNEVLFSARGAGKRTDLGVFEEIMKYTALWSQDETYVPEIVNDSESVNIESYVKTVGLSVRACRWTKLHHGATGWYVGNDGQQYRTVVINTIEWMTENLKETKYANGDTIPEVTDAGDWEDLITGAWCYYDNKLANQ
jgi:uncharacterized protein (TIGR02145 family)